MGVGVEVSLGQGGTGLDMQVCRLAVDVCGEGRGPGRVMKVLLSR